MLVISPQFPSSMQSSYSLLHLPFPAAFSVVYFIVDEILKNGLNKEWYNHLICNDHKIKIAKKYNKIPNMIKLFYDYFI